MYLKTLLIHGFKSFADKTQLDFHKGVTGIVGPNGCGKSNVVDAIRWVLGETSAKALRGDEMADVIFNGTDKRKPVGMAEVTLTMADCEQALKVEYNEVAITRRVFRDGRSEYRLNGNLCRLKDIHDLFAGTGIGRAAYSIMAQGQIDMLLSSKPEDRRAVFEEAAGITKFKGQKREALRKLEYTEANLLRVEDVVAEVKRQMASLQRQAAKAKRYQVLLDDSRMLDTHLAHRQWQQWSGEKAQQESQSRQLQEQIDSLQESLQAAEREALETREAYHGIESQINHLRAQAQELRSQMQAAEGRIGFNEERCEELTQRIAQNHQHLEAARNMLGEHRRELDETEAQIELIRANIEQRQEALHAQQAAHDAITPDRSRLEEQRRQVRESIRHFEGQIASCEARASSLQNQIQTDTQRIDALGSELTHAAHSRATAQEEHDTLNQRINELESSRNELEERAKTCARDIIEQRRRRDEAQERLIGLKRQSAERRSRIEVLQLLLREGEGLAQGTQQVLKGLDQPERYGVGVRGLLASAITVAPEHIAAVEAALREHLQAVLLSDSELAGEILEALTLRQLGEACLLPADLATQRRMPDRQLVPEGAVAWARDLVQAQPEVAAITDRLLANVLVVPDLITALIVKQTLSDVAVVTLRGECIGETGLLHGGSSNEEGRGASLLRRQAELGELQHEAQRIDEETTLLQSQLEQMRLELEDMHLQEQTLREQSQRTREEFSQISGKLSVVQRSLQQATARLESVEWDQRQIQTRIEQAREQIAQQQLEAGVAQEQRDATLQREAGFEVELESFLRRELESSERLGELRNALALEQNSLQGLLRQQGPMTARQQELEGSLQRLEAEISSWGERIEQTRADNTRYAEQVQSQREAIEQIDEHIAGRSEERAAAFERASLLENQLTELRQRSQSLLESRNRIEVQLTRVDLRLENLQAQVQERYSFQLTEFTPDYAALAITIEEQRGRRRSPRRNDNDEATHSGDEGLAQSGAPEEFTSPLPQVEAASVEPQDEERSEDQLGDDIDPASLDWDFVTEIVTELRQRLENIGPVNLDAISEFEELQQRHDFLDNQFKDLTNSKQELLEVIARINETTKTMFSETFAKVRENFQNNFRELFGASAKADLLLIDEADPLESGIDIIAKPPGKKLQTITLLSGGERSMTAVALLFSIYQVKPSPFCVLDELDAPLDESNISRFLKMLDHFIDDSQFIIVTHNKRTMGRADVIYGVTMQESGVSKPVGVRMTTAPETRNETTSTSEDEAVSPKLPLEAEVQAEEAHHSAAKPE